MTRRAGRNNKIRQQNRPPSRKRAKVDHSGHQPNQKRASQKVAKHPKGKSQRRKRAKQKSSSKPTTANKVDGGLYSSASTPRGER